MEGVFVEGRKFKWGFHSEEEWLINYVLNGVMMIVSALLMIAQRQRTIVVQLVQDVKTLLLMESVFVTTHNIMLVWLTMHVWYVMELIKKLIPECANVLMILTSLKMQRPALAQQKLQVVVTILQQLALTLFSMLLVIVPKLARVALMQLRPVRSVSVHLTTLLIALVSVSRTAQHHPWQS